MGYYGILLGLQYKNASEMMAQFDAGIYDIEETGTIKIPFKTSHIPNSEIFERINGDFERDGEVYRLIKQRLYRDTFHIVYIKDKTGTTIKKVLSDYVKTFSDVPIDDGQQSLILPFFIKEYFTRDFSIQHETLGWQQAVRKESHAEVFVDDFIASIIHPPERS